MSSGRHSKTTPATAGLFFDAWLADATRGLCDFAKGQVREEYEDHFAAAYEDLRAEGLGEKEAERVAVESLGDARATRKKLRRVYLTRGEDTTLGQAASVVNVSPSLPVTPLSRGTKLGISALLGLPLLFIGVFVGTSLGGGTGTLIGFLAGGCVAASVVFALWLTCLGVQALGESDRFRPQETVLRYLRRRLRSSLLFFFAIASYMLLLVFGRDDWHVPEMRVLVQFGGMVAFVGFLLVAVLQWRHMNAIIRKLETHPDKNATPNLARLTGACSQDFATQKPFRLQNHAERPEQTRDSN